MQLLEQVGALIQLEVVEETYFECAFTEIYGNEGMGRGSFTQVAPLREKKVSRGVGTRKLT